MGTSEVLNEMTFRAGVIVGMIVMMLIFLLSQVLVSWLGSRRRRKVEIDAIEKLEKNGYQCLMPSNALEHFENLNLEQRLYIKGMVILDSQGNTVTRFIELTQDSDTRAQLRRANFSLIRGGKK